MDRNAARYLSRNIRRKRKNKRREKRTETDSARQPASSLTCPTLYPSNASTGYAPMTYGYHGCENHPRRVFFTFLNLGIRSFSTQKEIADGKVELFVDIPGFFGVDLEHHRVVTDAMSLGSKVGTVE